MPPFHESIRKRQTGHPKFYLFDLGIRSALLRTLHIPVEPKSYAYGNLFEHFIIHEIFRLNHYKKSDWELFYLRTKDDCEIDLIMERPGEPRILIEIKSTDDIRPDDLRTFTRLSSAFSNSKRYCFSRDSRRQIIDGVDCLPWQAGLKEIGL